MIFPTSSAKLITLNVDNITILCTQKKFEENIYNRKHFMMRINYSTTSTNGLNIRLPGMY